MATKIVCPNIQVSATVINDNLGFFCSKCFEPTNFKGEHAATLALLKAA